MMLGAGPNLTPLLMTPSFWGTTTQPQEVRPDRPLRHLVGGDRHCQVCSHR